MQRITTSVKRVREAGYWCDDAEEETSRLMQAVGVDWSAEIPIEDALYHIGLGAALMFLGAPRPKYATAAHTVLVRYIRHLIKQIEKELNVNLSVEELVIFNDSRDSLRANRRAYWRREKDNSYTPKRALCCQALLILMSLHPLHIRAVHAGRAYLSAGAPDKKQLDNLSEYLQKLLTEPV